MDFRGIKEFLKDISGYVILVVAILLVVNYVITFQQNIGPSMQPTIENGEAFLLNKLAYKIGKPKRGQIVAVYYNEKYLVKRVIGLPNEKIEYKDNILYINGEAYKEEYLSSEVVTYDFTMDDITGTVDEVIPEGYYLVLGDNRTNSQDSREIGLVKKSDIVGRTSFRVWPLNRIGIIN